MRISSGVAYFSAKCRERKLPCILVNTVFVECSQQEWDLHASVVLVSEEQHFTKEVRFEMCSIHYQQMLLVNMNVNIQFMVSVNSYMFRHQSAIDNLFKQGCHGEHTVPNINHSHCHDQNIKIWVMGCSLHRRCPTE